jgi:hypothetical protein
VALYKTFVDTDVTATVHAAHHNALATAIDSIVISADPAFGNNATDATAHLQSLIDSGASAGIYVPRGVYLVSAPLENVTRMALAPGATIKATAAMAAVVRTSLTVSLVDGGISGQGTIDANDLADTTIHARSFVQFEISGLNLINGKVSGIKLGDATASRSAQAHLTNLHIQRMSSLTVRSGSIGLLIENSGDHSISQIVINAFDIGVYSPAGGGGMFHDVHVWTSPPQGRTTTCFEDHGNLNQYVQCCADTPALYGFRLYGYQTSLIGCGTYNNSNDPAAVTGTGTVVGIRFESTNSLAAIVGNYFYGASTAQLKADVEANDGVYTTLQIIGSSINQVITVRTLSARVISLAVRDTLSASGGFAADNTVATSNLGLSIRTGGLDRWKLVSDGGTESGSNAGSGFSLRRYSDAGAFLAEVLTISRTTGTVTLKNALVMSDGIADITAGTTTGLKVGTGSAQKLGFWGVVPTVKPTALTAPDASTVASTYDTNAQNVINNLRTRLNSLETKLQTIGLLT